MKKKICLYFLLLLGLLLTGCGPDQAEPEDYFPAEQGNNWEYAGTGNEYASFKSEVLYTQDDDRVQIQEINPGTSTAAVYTITDKAVTRVYLAGEKYHQENLLQEADNDHTIVLKTPLRKGTKWSTKKGQREIQSVAETVKTPAGTFKNCIKIIIKEAGSTGYEYYCEDIGLVKREFDTPDMQVSSILTKYQVEEDD